MVRRACVPLASPCLVKPHSTPNVPAAGPQRPLKLLSVRRPFDPANQKIQTENRRKDENERKRQTFTPEFALGQRVLSGFRGLLRNLQARLHVLLDRTELEDVDGDARLGERVAGLIELQTSFADLHSRRLRLLQQLIGALDARFQLPQGIVHFLRRRVTGIARYVALGTERFRPGANIFIGRVQHAVIAVTGDTARQARILKGFPVRTLFIKLRLKDVAVRANVLHGAYARRRGAMIAVTRGARRSAQIAANDQGVVVDAGVVLRELVRGNRVALHVLGVGMAARAGLGNVEGIDGGLGVVDRAQIVNAVATAAQRGNLAAGDFPAKARGLAHGVHVRFRGVAAVASGAGQTLLGMDVVGELFFGDFVRRVESGMADHAVVHDLRANRAGQPENRRQEEQPPEARVTWRHIHKRSGPRYS